MADAQQTPAAGDPELYRIDTRQTQATSLAADAQRTPAYGSAESASTGSLENAEEGRKKFEWHQRGAWWQLLIAAVVPVLSQFAALSIIAITAFTTKDLFMSCDSRVIGLRAAFFCEITKASLRYFPVLAMVISLIIAMRAFLRQRIYYQMLTHGYLLDFENVTPIKDPLFICLIICLALGSLHLVLIFIHSPNLEEFKVFAKSTLTNYFAPAAAFLGFLAGAYDTESQLLPLSKYIEEHPVIARATLARMPVVPEHLASVAVREGLHIPVGKETCTSQECYAELVEATGSKIFSAGDNIEHYKSSPAAAIESGGTRLLRGNRKVAKFVAEMWPARLLLDVRLQDPESRVFRSVWHAVAALVFPLSIAVVFFFVIQAVKDFNDVREGQYSDAGGLIVELMYALVTAWLLASLFDLVTIPFRSQPARQ